MRRLVLVVSALLVGLAGCGGSDDVRQEDRPAATPTVSAAEAADQFGDLVDRLREQETLGVDLHLVVPGLGDIFVGAAERFDDEGRLVEVDGNIVVDGTGADVRVVDDTLYIKAADDWVSTSVEGPAAREIGFDTRYFSPVAALDALAPLVVGARETTRRQTVDGASLPVREFSVRTSELISSQKIPEASAGDAPELTTVSVVVDDGGLVRYVAWKVGVLDDASLFELRVGPGDEVSVEAPAEHVPLGDVAGGSGA